jgi:hypothetical protein
MKEEEEKKEATKQPPEQHKNYPFAADGTPITYVPECGGHVSAARTGRRVQRTLKM